jgi:deazaflavin-dependent oxidoreductase (nitroreductase family)
MQSGVRGQGGVMAKQYRVDGKVRTVNKLVKFLNRFGLGPPNSFILHSQGRKSGEQRSTPVTLAILGGSRYLVAPYGTTGWVHNLRAAGGGALEFKGQREEISVTELSGAEAGPVLKHYFDDLKIVRPFFDAEEGDGAEVFTSIADGHPVFKIQN